ncbi:replication initiator protein A [Bacteroides heparinolyticus]
MSGENGWIDEVGRLYIIFSLRAIQEAMNCAEKSAIKYLTRA